MHYLNVRCEDEMLIVKILQFSFTLNIRVGKNSASLFKI